MARAPGPRRTERRWGSCLPAGAAHAGERAGAAPTEVLSNPGVVFSTSSSALDDPRRPSAKSISHDETESACRSCPHSPVPFAGTELRAFASCQRRLAMRDARARVPGRLLLRLGVPHVLEERLGTGWRGHRGGRCRGSASPDGRRDLDRFVRYRRRHIGWARCLGSSRHLCSGRYLRHHHRRDGGDRFPDCDGRCSGAGRRTFGAGWPLATRCSDRAHRRFFVSVRSSPLQRPVHRCDGLLHCE